MHSQILKRVHKFFRLPREDRRLYTSVGLRMLGVKLALHLLPFRHVRRWAECGTLIIPQQPSPVEEIPRIVTAVERIGHALQRLGTNCLPQALTACRLMRNRGYDVRLKIGVQKDAWGRLGAHAWVELEGRVILGGLRSPDRFAPFPELAGTRP